MPNSTEKVLLFAALIKWVDGEPLSAHDFQRILNLIVHSPMTVDSPSEEEIHALHAKFRATLEQGNLN